ncbi:glycosyltransferase [Actinophytocola oryzae]|uniref:Glycosyltransferase involved in cell wall biosynthesis n=1 Tax=Actinophytocola oryzae TaxID=502181 RepID=A0A4R7VG55_9PSEU|nr:glycosyltransferase [Actinophytocola oryzae]TDV48028.1 glycosyltransferase involved in cell wall biosynthesis [Actinophytocola oryzae]
MHIAMISAHASPLTGEVEPDEHGRHVGELSAALVRAGHEVTVYTRKASGRQAAEVCSAQGYRVVHLPAGPAKHVPRDELLPYLGEFTRRLRTRFAEDLPDVVHSHFWLSGLAAVFVSMAAPMPIVHTFHSLGTTRRRNDENDPSPVERIRLERMVGQSVTRVIATSEDEVRELRGMRVTGRHVSVVPRGMDCDRFRPDGPRLTRRLRCRVVSAGQLAPRTGFADVVEAMTHLPDTELVIAGGPDRERLPQDPVACRLRELAERVGVADRVRLVGQVPTERMPELLRSADVAACVPWYEPSGNEALEAMACGVPVLATSVGDLADTVVDGATGVLVPPRRPEKLAAAMRALLADPARRDFLGATGRERVEVHHRWDRIARDTADVYEESRDRALTCSVS